MSIAKRKRQDVAESQAHEGDGDGETLLEGSSSLAVKSLAERGGSDLVKSLRSGSNDTIREALLYLRRSTALSSYDERPTASDKRIQLALQFLEHDIGLQGTSDDSSLLKVWDTIESQNQSLLLPLPLFALSNLIALLGVHQPNHHYIDRLISSILPTQRSAADSNTRHNTPYWARLQSHLSNATGKKPMQGAPSLQSSEVIIMASLRLLYEMTNYAGGKYSKVIFDSMNWTMRSIPRLLNMRRRAKGSKPGQKASSKDKAVVTLDRPDIRTLWTLYLLSFLRLKSGILQPASLQLSVLALGKEALPAILKGLVNDSSQVVVFILMTLHEALLSDEAATRLPRSKVVSFFSEWACKELLGLYDRQSDLVNIMGSTQERHSIADVIHHFMLALCTHPGRGICYIDQGWYGRQVSDDKLEEEKEGSGLAVYNKILLGLLKSLSPTRSTKQAELSLRILESSQELIAPYFDYHIGTFSSSSLEPRGVAIGWLSTAAFLGRVLSLPLPEATQWKEDPPSFDRCIRSLLPTNLSAGILQRGIQHKDAITRHAALVLLSRLLMRLLAFKNLCDDVAHQADEGVPDQSKSSWCNHWEEIKEEVKPSIPEMSALLATLQQKYPMKIAKEGESAQTSTKQTSSLIAEATLRAANLRFDVFADANASEVSFLLSDLSLSLISPLNEDATSDREETPNPLSVMCQLHTIQLLTSVAKTNPGGFDLSATQGSKSITPLHTLLSLARDSALEEVREASWDLIAASMTDTILFEHDQDEWSIWRYALEHCSEEMLSFFDECVQRCLKIPYRYLEMSKEDWPKTEADVCISPLFYTLREQYFIRLQSGLMATQETRLAYPLFLSSFVPAVHAYHAENVTQAKTAPSVLVLDKILQSLQEAMLKSTELQIEGGKQGDKYWPDRDESKAIEQAFQYAHQATLCLVSGAIESNNTADTKSNGTTIKANAANGEGNLLRLPFLKRDKSHDNPDTLLFSPIEANILLVFCRNSIAKQNCSCHTVKDVMRIVVHNGQASSSISLSIILEDRAVLVRCGQDAEMMQMVLETLLELSCSLDDMSAKNLVPRSLFSVATELAYASAAEDRHRHLRISLVQLYTLLKEEEQIRMWNEESDIDILYNIAVQLPEEHRWSNEGRWVHLVKSLMSSDVAEKIQKCLFLLKKLSKDSTFSTRLDLIAAQANVIDCISLHSNARLFDDALRVLIKQSPVACRHMMHVIKNSASNDVDLFKRLPLSVTQTMSQCQAQHDEYSDVTNKDFRESVQVMIKSNLACLFSEDHGIALPFAHFCVIAEELSSIDTTTLNDLLITHLPKKPAQVFKQSVLLFATQVCLQRGHPLSSSTFVTSLVDMSLLWLVRRFAEDPVEDEETTRGVEAFIVLLTRCGEDFELKAHLVEPVISAAILNRIGSLLHLKLIDMLMQMTPIKKPFLRKVLNDLVANREAITNVEKRTQVVDMIYRRLQKDSLLCEASLVTSMIPMYEGSLIESDRKLLLIFQQYEAGTGTSVMNLLEEHWKSSINFAANEINLGILSRMDYLRLHETSLKYPRSRGFEDMIASGHAKEVDRKDIQEAVYDPLLILSIVGDLMSRVQSLSGLHWIELIRSNALGVVIISLSSKMNTTRKIAKMLLSRIYTSVQSVQFQEKDHLLLILDYARNCFTNEEKGQEDGPLPLTTTLFVAFCLRSLGAPSLYLYPLISRFLLQRPLPDSTDIPLLYNFLYSSSSQSTTYKAEKTFIIRYILICIKYGGKMEWNIIKRRHVWDSIATMYASDDTESSTKHIIEEIFLTVTVKSDISFRVVVRHGFLQYLGQLLLQQSGEMKGHTTSFIIQCMANLLETLDLDRLERAVGPSYMMSFVSLLPDGETLLVEMTNVKLLRNYLICLKRLHEQGVKVDLEIARSRIDIIPDVESNKMVGATRSDPEVLFLQCKSMMEYLEMKQKELKRNESSINPTSTTDHDTQMQDV